jgi:outer membrane protein assembly factor BamE (lipoprotein component of BamABCDE complex)
MNVSACIRGRRLMPAAVLLAAMASWSCQPTTDIRGNMPLDEVVESIEKGKQNRDQIVAILGTPSTKAAFGDQETWYYIGSKTETVAFFEPKLLERKIVVIRFDSRGFVDTVTRYDATNGKKIEVVDRVTPTKGKELTVIEQILGNVGRFKADEE